MELLEEILSKENLNLAFKRVVSNKGSAGVDGATRKANMPVAYL